VQTEMQLLIQFKFISGNMAEKVHRR